MKEKLEEKSEDRVMSNEDKPKNDIPALPTDCILHIFSFLTQKEKSRVLKTSMVIHEHPHFQSEWNKTKLIAHVLRGEEEDALNMIKDNPKLLLSYGSAEDYSARVYAHVTAFQAALFCHDKWLWQKMLPLFQEIQMEGFDADEEIARQFHEAFRNGIPEQKPYDFDLLIQVIENSSEDDVQAALNKENNGSKLAIALAEFKEAFTELSLKEKFYNPQHLIKLLDIYNAKFMPWSYEKLQLLWSRVYGFSQRFVPTCYAQAFCRGLYYVVEKNEPLARSLSIGSGDDKFSYYPLPSGGGLGSDFGVFAGRPRARVSHGEWRLACLKTFVEQIQQSYLDFNINYPSMMWSNGSVHPR